MRMRELGFLASFWDWVRTGTKFATMQKIVTEKMSDAARFKAAP
jgi:hypothetical protein